MSQLPLLPRQQRTTTRYEPFVEQKSGSVFRPKLPSITRSDKTLPRTAVSLQGKYASLHRAALMGLSTGSAERATFQRRSVEALQRSLHWLMYEERRERALIVSTAFATSPVQCYSSGNGVSSLSPWRFVREPPILTTDAELMRMLKNAFRRVLERNTSITAAPQHLEAEEAARRQCDIVEPWYRRCTTLGILQELLQGKLMIWNEFVRQLEVWRQLLEVVREEKLARLTVLGQYISCSTPLPCKYLLWDMELLEASRIPLEPEVNLLCLFVSTVVGENGFLQDSLLAEREEELSVLGGQYKLSSLAFEGIQRIRRDEAERFETLLGYNAFCLKLADEKSEHAAVRWPRPPGGNLVGGVSHGVRRSYLHHVAERRGHVFLPYFTYIRIVKSLGMERATRAEITAYEFVELCFLMYTYESLCRRVVAAEEEVLMQKLVGDVEAQERQLLWWAEAEALEQDIQPDQFRHRSHALIQSQREERARQLQRTRLQVTIQLLVEYERARRGELVLLETELRTTSRCTFYAVCGRGGDKCVVLRWMLQHQLHLVIREEERLRLLMVNDEADSIFATATAHTWLMEYGDTMYQAARRQKVQHAGCHLMAELQQIRVGVESRCQWERQVLFEETLCVPVCTTRSSVSPPADSDCSEAVNPDLDIRRVVVSGLSEFLQDEVLLTLFGCIAP
ncbi:uncharacterized protein Tco025E_06154 [Trypanosoma conorhini]|uniref:Uncharacterized protein n=1 Tax=Trypanosoma conorhini TaxID=83891 RepID=A0A3R7N6J5_9TRYP|nr:uncharacterized protein Tco025E_06154 [Trypanosoma conorhini]RNF13606.1 hypothetical protein Tco025E_06154 [Trypanosoma conorhini]